MSSAPVAQAFVVENTADALVVASARGKFLRTTVGEVPIRRREVRKGRLSKGARLMCLGEGERGSRPPRSSNTN